jgi:hypothetical protein
MYGHPHALLDIARSMQQELLDQAKRAGIRRELRRRPIAQSNTAMTVGSVPRLRLVPAPVDETPCPEELQAS